MINFHVDDIHTSEWCCQNTTRLSKIYLKILTNFGYKKKLEILRSSRETFYLLLRLHLSFTFHYFVFGHKAKISATF